MDDTFEDVMMTKKSATKNNQTSSKVFTKIFVGIIGTILLGAIGSGLWDLVFRPGYDRFEKLTINISQSAENYAYESAALDPGSLPSLIILYILTYIPLLFALFFLTATFIFPYLDKRIQNWINIKDGDTKEKRRKRIYLFSTWLLILLFSITFFAARFGFSVANKAIWIWRVHQSNVELCSPYLSEAEIKSLNSEWRNINSVNDYRLIQKKLDAVATQHNIILKEIETARD